MLETYSVPIRYIDSLKEKQHIALFYEDPEYARLLEFRFIKNGLDSGEDCVYATEEDTGTVVLRLLNYGIPLEHFKSKRIRVYQTRPVLADRDMMTASCKLEISRLLQGLKTPFRIVARIVPDVSTLIGISVELELEQITHESFESLGGSIMCPYNISEIEGTKKSEWLRRLRDEHHAVIYAPKFDQGGVICSC
jgi:hypothetical protein